MGAIPLLICGDAPSASTGLGRITRELCIRIHENLGETFRLGTYGLGGGVAEIRIPTVHHHPNSKVGRRQTYRGCGATSLAMSANNYADLESEFVGVAGDAGEAAGGDSERFPIEHPFDRWLYAPIDAEGPNGKMPKEVAEVCMNFDRTLFYTKWAAEMMDRSECPIAEPYEHLPHGTDTKIFYPATGRKCGRRLFGQ